VLQSQYDGTDELLGIIARMISWSSRCDNLGALPQMKTFHYSPIRINRYFLPHHHMSCPTKALGTANDWGGILLRQSSLYLRFALKIDLSLKKGQFPDDRGFPIVLQWRNTTTIRFPMYQITIIGTDGIGDFRAEANRGGREGQHAGNTEHVLSNEDGTTTNANVTSPTSLLPTTDSFINQMQRMSVDGENIVSDDLDLPLDFGSFEMAEPEEGEMEFNDAAAWFGGIFLTSV
jgi:hypothetical protein